jgi:hypothetical protein
MRLWSIPYGLLRRTVPLPRRTFHPKFQLRSRRYTGERGSRVMGSEEGHQVGRLIPVGDSRGLREALLACFDDLETARAMGRAARSSAETGREAERY